jgi:hypothetical protein
VDEIFKELMRDTGAVGGAFTLWDVIVALVLSFFLSLAIVWVYKQTHRGLSYSLSFVHTIVIMAVTVSVVMLIVGSNIARAFALVGALSIIRFRTAIKDPRDVGFIFVAMAAGMATGVRMPVVAIAFTLVICPMIYFLHRFDIGAVTSSELLLRIHARENAGWDRGLKDVFYELLHENSLLTVEPIPGQGGEDGLVELVHSVQLKKGVEREDLLKAILGVDGVQRAAVLPGAQNVTV